MSANPSRDATTRASKDVDDQGQEYSNLSREHDLKSGQEYAYPSNDARPFQSQYSHLPPQHHVQSQGGYPVSGMHLQPGPYNMSQMTAALSDYPSQQQYLHSPQPNSRLMQGPNIVYQVAPNMAYATGPMYAGQPMYSQYPQQPYMHSYLQPSGSPHAGYMHFPPTHAGASIPPQSPQHSPAHMPHYYHNDMYGRPTLTSPTYNMSPGRGNRLSNSPRLGDASHGPSNFQTPGGKPHIRAELGSTGIPRGPPRKPKLSGHALWVGNLPPSANIMSLRDHFSQGFTKDIESIFLISKSNCAFVNYRSEEVCSKALQRFHDARFEGARLVCRLRKGSTAATGSNSGDSGINAPKPSDQLDQEELVDGYAEITTSDETKPTVSQIPDRYFIVKSLTLEDLEESVRTKIWATQTHNEDVMNKAYKTSDNVYLIFSANKSGAYFGYARMASPIVQDAGILGPIRRQDTSDVIALPVSISTPATRNAPRGHVVDDTSRGTIFWEAENSDDEDDAANSEMGEEETTTATWGKPFRVEWISTTSLPFCRTRGLRNTWNSNREVKIARDGTELESSVGKQLLSLFHGSDNVSAQS